MQEKEKLIHQLYYGNIVPQERPITQNSEYSLLHNKLNDLVDSFEQKLNLEDKKMFDEIMTTWSNISDVNGMESFTLGFKMGIKMILEVFDQEDILIKQP